MTERLIPVGVSSCLLGEKVRYDGDHQLQPVLTQVLSRYVEFRPFCPEMAIGLGVPRRPIHLEEGSQGLVCRGEAGEDYTSALRECAHDQPWHASLCGYIFKRSSPSCGLTEVKVYHDRHFRRDGTGIYAAEISRAFPALPVAEESVFNDQSAACNFLQRLFVMDRWQRMLEEGLTASGLTRFHAHHKMVLLSHCQKTYRELSALLGRLGKSSAHTLAPLYILPFMQALQKPATRGNHLNVLQHLQGYLKHLAPSERGILNEALQNFGAGKAPLSEPLALLRMHFKHVHHPWIAESWYVFPDPRELELRESL